MAAVRLPAAMRRVRRPARVRRGTLDFVLLKPKDAQFLVSTTRFSPWKSVNVVTALALYAYAFRSMGRAPSLGATAAAALVVAAAIAILYSITILTVSAAFYVVRIDNLTYLFSSVFDVARWPSSVFRGALELWPNLVEICHFHQTRHQLPVARVKNEDI